MSSSVVRKLIFTLATLLGADGNAEPTQLVHECAVRKKALMKNPGLDREVQSGVFAGTGQSQRHYLLNLEGNRNSKRYAYRTTVLLTGDKLG